ncbi:TPA: hypothetical protein ACNRV3_003466 [Escherichia coli]
MKLTLLSAMLMTAVVGITSANAADYKKLLLPPMQLIRGLAVGCHVTWINLRIVLKNPTHGLWCAITEQRLNFSTETGGKSEITTY